MSKILQNLAVGVGGLGALYYGQVGWQIYSSNNDYARSESYLQSAIKALTDSEKQEEDTRHLIETLSQRLVVYKDTLFNVEQDLQKAHQRVRELEKQKASIEDDMAHANRQVDDAQGRLATLAGELRKRIQAITLAEDAVKVAKLHRAEAQTQVNPLNHPMVKNLLSR